MQLVFVSLVFQLCLWCSLCFSFLVYNSIYRSCSCVAKFQDPAGVAKVLWHLWVVLQACFGLVKLC